MQILSTSHIPIRVEEDIVRVRQTARSAATDAGLSLVDSTKLVTAASELARNTLVYAGGGTAQVEALQDNGRRGVRVRFEDQGPGIADVQRALQDGFTSGKGLGLGLGGAKRLSNEFELHSTPGAGTTVVITRWTS